MLLAFVALPLARLEAVGGGGLKAGLRTARPMRRNPAQRYCNILPTSADVTKLTVCSEHFIQLSEPLTRRAGPHKQQHVLRSNGPGCVCADFLLLNALPADVLNTLR